MYFQWHWYYNVPGLPLWTLLLLLALVPKHNRSGQAWLILLLPLALVVFWLLVLVMIPDSSQLEMFGQFLTAVGIAWASVWLMGPWLRRADRVRTFFVACGTIVAVGVVAYVGHFGFWASSDITGPLSGFWVICLVPLIAATALTGWCSRGNCRPLLLLFWPMLWIPLVCGLCTAIYLVAMIVLEGGVGFSFLEDLLFMVLQGLMASVVISGVLYVLNLPVALLCMFTPCYRERYREGFCRIGDRDGLPTAASEFEGEGLGGNPFRL